MADSKITFPLVAKAHAVVSVVFAAVFIVAAFGWSFPWIGPAALLNDWDVSNPSLIYVSLMVAALLVGVGAFEWVFADSPAAKRPFCAYHAIVAAFSLYSSLAAANGWFGWLYAVLITLFLLAGMLGATDDSAAPMANVSDTSKMPMVAKGHALAAGLFGLVFLLATFGIDVPIIGPADLLRKWHMDNAALAFMARFEAGLLFGVAFYEWDFYQALNLQPSYNIYHGVCAVLAIYASIDAASWWFGWLYAVLITFFLAAGIVAVRL